MIAILVWVGFALAAILVAKSYKRDVGGWALGGFMFGPIALIALVVAGPLETDRTPTITCQHCSYETSDFRKENGLRYCMKCHKLL